MAKQRKTLDERIQNCTTKEEEMLEKLKQYQAQRKQLEEQKKAEEGMTGSAGAIEYETEVVGVETEVTGKIILLSASSILGVILVAVLSSCMFVVAQKPKEILSKMS